MGFQEMEAEGDECIADDLLIQPPPDVSAGGVCVPVGGVEPEPEPPNYIPPTTGHEYCAPTYGEMQQACPAEVAACVDDAQCLELLNAQLEGDLGTNYSEYPSYVYGYVRGYVIGNFVVETGTVAQCSVACSDGTWEGCVAFTRPPDDAEDHADGGCWWVSNLNLVWYDNTTAFDTYVVSPPALAVRQCWASSLDACGVPGGNGTSCLPLSNVTLSNVTLSL